MTVIFEINRARHAFEIEPWTTLLDLLREHCGPVHWLRTRRKVTMRAIREPRPMHDVAIVLHEARKLGSGIPRKATSDARFLHTGQRRIRRPVPCGGH
ncbi:NADPH-dependent ferric siderophore reductase [Paraburkholderia sp. GAS448]|uniref:hypothetical protein n=1 Tax=Paraburkholderia sp. GAS448 TaxID=3035136 RepID=UPI003D22DAA5